MPPEAAAERDVEHRVDRMLPVEVARRRGDWA